MRLSHPSFLSPGFQFSSFADLKKAVGNSCSDTELEFSARLFEKNLPAVTSRVILATMLGVNPGLIWSYQFRPRRHYREFSIQKGKGLRLIQAPRATLKVVQKWLAIKFGENFIPPRHVFGFVPGRSHVDAALTHLGSRWIFGVDLKDFFQTTPQALLEEKLLLVGYPAEGARLVAQIGCLNGSLAQGAPCSPIFSNLCFSDLDVQLENLAKEYECKITRYADDIVFSGVQEFPVELKNKIADLFSDRPWNLALEKTNFSQLPARLKVHGLLVDGDKARLTKGYRNKIRGFQHILQTAEISAADRSRLLGHVNYKKHVDQLIEKNIPDSS